LKEKMKEENKRPYTTKGKTGRRELGSGRKKKEKTESQKPEADVVSF